MLTQTQAAMALNGLPGIGPVAVRRLREAFDDDLAAVFSAEKNRIFRIPGIGKSLGEKIFAWQEFFDLEKEERALAAHGIKFIPFFAAAFPPLLKKIPDPPTGLYVRGNADALSTTKATAIVGTRKASLYGTANAEKIARELATAGWLVVSGGARGIDTAAHKGALASDHGKTCAVLGCGLDIVYPPENFELFKNIAENGGALVSEFPFGKKADRRTFPQRNRVIAGIAAGTLVVESDLAGGSIITANFAADCGRSVFALPGRVEQPGSRGCHKLIREGATLATGAEDILEDLAGTDARQMLLFDEKGNRPPNAAQEHETREPLNATAEKILSLLQSGEALSPDSIAAHIRLPFPLVSANLLLLELDRRVARKADGSYEIVE